MNYKMICRFLGLMLTVGAIFLLPALVISLCCARWMASIAFTATFGIMGAVAAALLLIGRRATRLFGPREGMVAVSTGWLVLSALGCLPFVFSGEIPAYIDAFFETVSGFTTTGASVLSAPEELTEGMLYWRSFTHWLGGMGVLVFLLAIVPGGNQGGFTMHLLRAESPGPDVGKLVPRMRKTAAILYLIYIVMTVLNVIFLLLGGEMGVLEAVCTAFGTAGTGGFGARGTSLAEFSAYTQNVTTVFMFLFGVNFSCYYLMLLGSFKSVFKDEELRTYIFLALGAIVLIALNIRSLYGSWEETVRHSAFQVSSIMTTTGFATTDFDLWPMFSKGILLLLMVVGACAGSTGGGFKVARLLLVFKSLRRNICRVIDPKKVEVVRMGGRTVSETVLDNTNAYTAAYVVIIVISFLLISVDPFVTGVDTGLSAVLACFNNIGPGLAAVGPTCNYAGFSLFSKIILSLDMLAGRLEIFPMLILLSRSTWRRK